MILYCQFTKVRQIRIQRTHQNFTTSMEIIEVSSAITQMIQILFLILMAVMEILTHQKA